MEKIRFRKKRSRYRPRYGVIGGGLVNKRLMGKRRYGGVL